MTLYRPLEDAGEPGTASRFSIADSALPLSDVLPMLEHMGFKVMDEMPFEVLPKQTSKTVPRSS